MSPSPLLFTDTQADILGSSFPPSPLSLSPQPSQISPLIVQSPEVDTFWHEPFLSANDFLPKDELEGVPPYFLDGGIIDPFSVSPGRCFE